MVAVQVGEGCAAFHGDPLATEEVILDDRAAADLVERADVIGVRAAGGAFDPLPVGIVEIALDDGGAVLDLFQSILYIPDEGLAGAGSGVAVGVKGVAGVLAGIGGKSINFEG